MKHVHHRCWIAVLVVLVVSVATWTACEKMTIADKIPEFKVDPYWPKPLPNNWIIGQVSGIAIDSKDHVF